MSDHADREPTIEIQCSAFHGTGIVHYTATRKSDRTPLPRPEGREHYGARYVVAHDGDLREVFRHTGHPANSPTVFVGNEWPPRP